MLRDMQAKNLIAIASFMLNKASRPRLVAILPQTEVVDEEDGIQIIPGGMNLILLPFLTELRNCCLPETVGTSSRSILRRLSPLNNLLFNIPRTHYQQPSQLPQLQMR